MPRQQGHCAGRSPHWVKVKNRKHPAMERMTDTVWIYVNTKEVGDKHHLKVFANADAAQR